MPEGEGGAIFEDVGDECLGGGFWIVGVRVCVPGAWGEGDDPIVEALGVLGVDGACRFAGVGDEVVWGGVRLGVHRGV